VAASIIAYMGTTRCDCKQLSFLALRSFALRNGITDVAELIRQTGCCTGCGTCRPHLEEFLRTGELKCGDQMFKAPAATLRPKSPPLRSLDARAKPPAPEAQAFPPAPPPDEPAT